MNFTSLDFNTWKKNSLDNAIKYSNKDCKVNVHILVDYDKDEKEFNAHALEFDIVASAPSRNKALKELLELIVSHISFCAAYDNKDKIVFAAPTEYWQKFYLGIQEGTVDSKPKIPKLDIADSQIPYRPSTFNNVCLLSA